jgi:hypothetical protein
MNELKYTLYSDGSSNQVLIPVINWLLRSHLPHIAIQGKWADLRRLHTPPPKENIPERIRWSLELYPCNLLFIHRDAETETVEKRISEIDAAVRTVKENGIFVPLVIPVVPVRMLEAWFLFDISAIRRAAGNPPGTQSLTLPRFNTLENVPDPKVILHNLLRDASGLTGRRLKSFNPRSAFHTIPSFIENFEPLRNLSSFQGLENLIKQTVPSINLM